MTLFKGHGRKVHPAACRCNFGLVCGECLARAAPGHFTGDGYRNYFSSMNDLAIAQDRRETDP